MRGAWVPAAHVSAGVLAPLVLAPCGFPGRGNGLLVRRQRWECQESLAISCDSCLRNFEAAAKVTEPFSWEKGSKGHWCCDVQRCQQHMFYVHSWDLQIPGDYKMPCSCKACRVNHLGRPQPETGTQWEEKKGQEAPWIPCTLNPTSCWPAARPWPSLTFAPSGEASCMGNGSGCKEGRCGSQVWEPAGKKGRR